MKYLVYCLGVALVMLLLAWQVIPASHDRPWQDGFSRLPQVTVSSSSIAVAELRNWQYTQSGDVLKQEWMTATITPETIDRLYMVVESFGDSEAVAHTMLAFTTTDGMGYVISVEARREEGETYSALRGALWPSYEYMYVWTSERDMYANSEIYHGDPLHMYELDVTKREAWEVVKRLAEKTAALSREPRWYNTMFANCTNVLARTINELDADRLPFGVAWVLPGYTPEYLAAHELLKSDAPLESVAAEGHLSPYIKTAYIEADPRAFSVRLRELLHEN